MDGLNAWLDLSAFHTGCLFQTPYPEAGTCHAFTTWFQNVFQDYLKIGSTRSSRKGIELSDYFLMAEKKRKVLLENTNEDIIGTRAANCGTIRMDRCTINEGGGQDDIHVSFADTQFPSRHSVPTAAKPPHGGGIKIKASRSRKQPEEVVSIDEHGPAKRTRSRTSATKSSSGSLSIEVVSQKGKASTSTNILTSNVAAVISEPPKHEASDKYNDRVDYEDLPCLDLSSHDDALPDSARSQGVTFVAMAKEDRPSQSTATLDCQHVKGAGVVTSLNEAMLIRPLAIEKDRIVEILSSPSLASGHPIHSTLMEPPFDAVRESANSIHTLHGVKEGNIPSLLKADKQISTNAKRKNVGSILKPMSSARSTSEAANGLGTTDTPPSTAVGSEQGASFAPMSLEGKGALNPWLAIESTFQNNITEDVYREPARIFAKKYSQQCCQNSYVKKN
ncbi:hypothetical protein MRB53_023665 [Persea americana]|uniref:Uncharacterized protein n=1 Tax=Persea americana TaxID=3435 RepID=A0ACC2LA18_PERAE|nr:hypothetical protein MRB53_023665 [Persea americana]